MSPVKTKSIREQILTCLDDHGPQTIEGMLQYVKGFQKNSVHSKALELMHAGLVIRDQNMVWSLAEGVTKNTPLNQEERDEDSGSSGGGSGAIQVSGAPLAPKGQFEELLRNVGITPKEVIPTITGLFMSGDIDDLNWLNKVLTQHAAGYVKQHEKRLIMSSWSHTRGLPYRDEDFSLDEGESVKGKKGQEKDRPKSAVAQVIEDTGVGYQIIRDKDGVWVPKTGGPLSYEAALDRCERQNAIRAMNSGMSSDDDDDSGDDGDSKPAKGGRKQPKTLEYMMMEKMIDKFFDGNQGSNEAQSATIQALRDEIRQMKDSQLQARFDSIEANLAAIAGHNPWDDPVEIARMRQVLGVQTSNITDSSPAVQIIRDSSEKLDKNVGRVLGMFERMAIQGDVFRPEDTRTPEQRESKAGALLAEAEKREQSRDIRKRAFSL
jgi:hypothetical protein